MKDNDMSANPLSVFGVPHAGEFYLAERGITVEQAKAVGGKFVTHAEADILVHRDKESRSFYPKRDALWLPTRGPTGLLHGYHGQAIYFNPGKKPFKLHTIVTDEYPNEVSYFLYKNEPGETIYWCESFIKALNLYILGLNAIGMNGVNGFCRKQGRIVASTKLLSTDQKHIILTDSLNYQNARSSNHVRNARDRWRLALRSLTGSTAYFLELPPPHDDWKDTLGNPKYDWGIDDFRKVMGDDKTREFLSGANGFLDSTELSLWIKDYNTRFVYVKALSKIYYIEDKQIKAKQNFFDDQAPDRVDDIPVAQAWFKSSSRAFVKSLVFRPGKPEFVDSCLNLWNGFSLKPATMTDEVRATVKALWVDTIYEAFGPEGKYLIEFCASLVQFPENRLSRYVFLGGKQGTGKGFVIEPLIRIFGKTNHCVDWDLKKFINGFNVLHRACRLGIVNEPGNPSDIPKADLVAVGEMLKKNADQNTTTFLLEPKGVDAAIVDRLQSNIVISNYGPPFDIQADDRRGIFLYARQEMAIPSANNAGTKNEEFWAARWNWLNNQNGSEEIMAYLLEYDLSKVNFEGPAPVTRYKTALLGGRHDTVQGFMSALNVNPLGVCREALGDDFQLPKPFVFDAQSVALLYTLINQTIDNEQAFTTTVGKLALNIWECQSETITQRTGKSSVSARVFAIQDNRVQQFLKVPGQSGETVISALTQFKVQLRDAIAARTNFLKD